MTMKKVPTIRLYPNKVESLVTHSNVDDKSTQDRNQSSKLVQIKCLIQRYFLAKHRKRSHYSINDNNGDDDDENSLDTERFFSVSCPKCSRQDLARGEIGRTEWSKDMSQHPRNCTPGIKDKEIGGAE